MSRFLTTNRNIELLEPYEGKLSCTVLRGEGGSNALDLPDIQKQGDFFVGVCAFHVEEFVEKPVVGFVP